MPKTIPQRELPTDDAQVIEAVTRTFISGDDVAALASAEVRIDRRRFLASLDGSIDQGL